MKKRALALLFILFILVASLLFSGCSKSPVGQAPVDQNKTLLGDESNLITTNLTLYFSDNQAMYLMPESRQIKIRKDASTESMAEAIVNELIAGPTDKKLIATIPKETKLLSVKITDQVANVDFSEEIRSKHPGGSTGELMTLNSLVDSLTELNGIKKVQILINGAKVDTLVGHADLSQPLNRDESIIKK
ncbi:MAG: hypothetical protein CVU90_12040 [Firmicutes bacterium HGW-Firmicutes-15]|nr:MAG: hypothetical protein CVU90_12040 [Firmicutes bacterium HGW-Firmicutes-15]